VSVIRGVSARRFAKRAGKVVIAVIALDLVATLATIAAGAVMLKR